MKTGSFERTTLWQRTLGRRDHDPDEQAREVLRAAFLGFRERAAALGGEIASHMPELTVHDVTHLDALWDVAELLAPDKFVVTPTEAFVLGGAFLTHDLGMGLAVYPEGLRDIRREITWKDAVASALKRKLGREPSPTEMDAPPEDVQRVATGETLRLLHAAQADRLALASWRDLSSGVEFHLLESPELRTSLGTVIGRIAASHWWSIDDVKRRLSAVLNPPSFCPRDWTVDLLKVAALLRAADAAQLDERRAPGFLAALRRPEGVASAHWRFQRKLQPPREEGQRLVYTSGEPFGLADADAWWLCLDSLRMVDRELRDIDSLFGDLGKQRLSARAVAGVEDPERLAGLVQTDGWVPVDTRVSVTDVPSLVERIGGAELYGRDPTVPLRELIQNAADAVRARRIHEGRPPDWGSIDVRVGPETKESWIEVRDSGVGMSRSVMAGPLLDFGRSYWGSELMRQEFPGLLAKGFGATGRFGIGFFSVFMWGTRVAVTTRRPDEAQKDTRVLEFTAGVSRRPILRPARDDERLLDGGTVVKVWLRDPPLSKGGLLHRNYNDFWTLGRLCAYLAPALDVDMYVEEREYRTMVVKARDWANLEPAALLRRTMQPDHDWDESKVRTLIPRITETVRDIRDESGHLVGRACVALGQNPDGATAAVVVGGMRQGHVSGCAGVFVGQARTAARDYAIPVASGASLRSWAEEQEQQVARVLNVAGFEAERAAEYCSALGASCEQLPLAYGPDGWLYPRDIRTRYVEVPEIVMFDTSGYLFERSMAQFRLLPNAIGVSFEGFWTLAGSRGGEVWPPELAPQNGPDRTLRDRVIALLAEGWATSFDEVLYASDLPDSEESFSREIGSIGGQMIVESGVSVIRNPKGSP